MFKRIKIAIASSVAPAAHPLFAMPWRNCPEKKREEEEERETTRHGPRTKDFYALLSHFRVYIVNWLTSNDEGAQADGGRPES